MSTGMRLKSFWLLSLVLLFSAADVQSRYGRRDVDDSRWPNALLGLAVVGLAVYALVKYDREKDEQQRASEAAPPPAYLPQQSQEMRSFAPSAPPLQQEQVFVRPVFVPQPTSWWSWFQSQSVCQPPVVVFQIQGQPQQQILQPVASQPPLGLGWRLLRETRSWMAEKLDPGGRRPR